MSLSSDQLEAKAERTRQRLSECLEQLESEISPTAILIDLFGFRPARSGAEIDAVTERLDRGTAK